MRRLVVVGGTGFFGRAASEMLREAGLTPIAAARRSGELRLDAEDPGSLCTVLRPGDVVLDAAGPFQRRSTALAEAAVRVGFDLVDLADALGYVERVAGLHRPARDAGVRLLPACSTASAVSCAMIAWSGIARPVGFRALLVPATRHAAVESTASSLLESVGQPIRVLREGALTPVVGFRKSRRWPPGVPLGGRRGWAFESADALTLPAAYPTLRTVEWFVDPNVPGLGWALSVAARLPPVRCLVARVARPSLPLARLLGGGAGGFACEVEGCGGAAARVSITAARGAYRLAVLPAVLAARALVAERLAECGVIPPHRQVDAAALREEAERLGFRVVVSRGDE